MKKYSYSFLFFLILSYSFLLNSCGEHIVDPPKSSFIDSTSSYNLTANDFKFIGEAHNMGLDFIFNNYIKYLNDIPLKNDYDYNVIELTKFYFNNVYSPTSAMSPIFINCYINLPFDSIVENFYSNNQQQIIYQIKNVFLKHSPIIALQELSIIEDSINHMTNDDEKIQLWCMVYIAKYSIEYWTSTKGQAWMNKFYSLAFPKIDNNTPIINDINWGTVAEKDFDGFVAGLVAYGYSNKWQKDAIVGAIRGALSGGGIGAVGGAILNVCGQAAKYGIVNATTMSAASIFYQLLH